MYIVVPLVEKVMPEAEALPLVCAVTNKEMLAYEAVDKSQAVPREYW